jgi:hypothetical protein
MVLCHQSFVTEKPGEWPSSSFKFNFWKSSQRGATSLLLFLGKFPLESFHCPFAYAGDELNTLFWSPAICSWLGGACIELVRPPGGWCAGAQPGFSSSLQVSLRLFPPWPALAPSPSCRVGQFYLSCGRGASLPLPLITCISLGCEVTQKMSTGLLHNSSRERCICSS